MRVALGKADLHNLYYAQWHNFRGLRAQRSNPEVYGPLDFKRCLRCIETLKT